MNLKDRVDLLEKELQALKKKLYDMELRSLGIDPNEPRNPYDCSRRFK